MKKYILLAILPCLLVVAVLLTRTDIGGAAVAGAEGAVGLGVGAANAAAATGSAVAGAAAGSVSK